MRRHRESEGPRTLAIGRCRRLCTRSLLISLLPRGVAMAHAFLRRPSKPWSWELATLQWVAWFNNDRLLESIGYIPPAEAEQLLPETRQSSHRGGSLT